MTTPLTPADSISAALASHNAGSAPVGAALISNGTSLVFASQPYDLSFFIEGQATANEIVGRFVAPRAFTIVTGVGSSDIVPVAATSFSITVNNTVVAVLNFAANAVAGVFAQQGGQSLSVAAGSVVELIAPSTPDTAMLNTSITLVGTR